MRFDPAVPILPMLLGEDAWEIIGAALGPAAEVTAIPKVRQVRYVPGSSAVVQYDASVETTEGSKSTETLVVSFGRHVPGGAALVEVGGHEVVVWRYPDDPYLPGLRAATNGDAVLGIFRELGVEASEVSLRRRAYRPSRRAVVEATTPEARLYLKVVRPARVADLQMRHASMSGALPVPRSLGWNRDLGVVVLESVGGRTLRETLRGGDVSSPPVESLLGLLDALPSPPAVPTLVTGPAARAPEFAKLLEAVVPELSPEVTAIVKACSTASDAESKLVPVHGDFHSSQILVSESGTIEGLVDVDSAGLGHRVHDLSQMLAHLAVLGQEYPRSGFNTFGAAAARAFDQLVDPVVLRLHVAGAILGFATGPFRVQEKDWQANTRARVELAAEWVQSAEAG